MTQRWAAQFGLLAAVAVLVISLGMLVSNAGDTSGSAPAATISGHSGQSQNSTPVTLSAADTSTTVAVQH